MKEITNETYSLCEAVADLAANFAVADIVPGDSRECCRLCIEWARQFEAEIWGVSSNLEYIEQIDAHFEMKYAEWLATATDKEKPTMKKLKDGAKIEQEVRVQIDVSITLNAKYDAAEVRRIVERGARSVFGNNYRVFRSIRFAEEAEIYSADVEAAIRWSNLVNPQIETLEGAT